MAGVWRGGGPADGYRPQCMLMLGEVNTPPCGQRFRTVYQEAICLTHDSFSRERVKSRPLLRRLLCFAYVGNQKRIYESIAVRLSEIYRWLKRC